MDNTSEYVLKVVANHPYYILAAGLLAAIYYTSLPQAPIYGSFDRAGTTLTWKAVHKVVQGGYDKIMRISDMPFVVRWWAKDYVILPAKYLVDLKGADWSHLNFFQNISDALFLHTTVSDLYTTPKAERMVNVVKKGLNPHLPYITQLMLDEIDDGFNKQLGDTKEGKEVKAMAFFGRVAHQTACRVMIGPELCRDEDFLNSTTGLLESIFGTAIVIVTLPLGPLRGVLSYLFTLPHRWKLQQCAKMLKPVVAARIQNRIDPKGDQLKNYIPDAIDWAIEQGGNDPQANDVDNLTKELLHNLWAASSAPGGLMTQIVYQLCFEPHYREPLKKEAEAAIAEHGWSEKTFSKLHLQDSFIREINRLYPTGSVACSRTIVDRPYTFSDGLTLPAGTRFGFPIKAIQCDPANFPKPLEFDGFRFVKDASGENEVAELSRRWTATAMATTNLAWGYGNHACPGRFFTVREMKLILTKLLLGYEFGWNRENKLGRPASVNVEGQFVPNLSQTIHIRRI